MRITRFVAAGVQSHLNFDIKFRDDFTFLIGLNGSGKTTALRLMMQLLSPDLPALASAKFESATIQLTDGEQSYEIFARKAAEGLTFGATHISSALQLTATELQLIEQGSNSGEPPPVLALALADPVCVFIQSLATPMFLGVDRRFTTGATIREPEEQRRRQVLLKRTADDAELRHGNVASGLVDVSLLVHETLNEIRGKQEALDDALRTRLLTSAFDFKPVALSEFSAPTPESIAEYQKRRIEIELAVETLKLPAEIVRHAIGDFFSRMNKVAEEIERSKRRPTKPAPPRGKDRWGAQASTARSDPPSVTVIEWMVNKPQVDRITTHLELLTEYGAERSALRQPIDRFLSLLNTFLVETKKKVVVSDQGVLMVELPSGERTQIGALSSGERQLVVMFGHLSLNKQLSGSGIFIVDEPELSLHISWQQRFVDAILEANPSVQLVTATHSPAIILDRDDHCESLDLLEAGE